MKRLALIATLLVTNMYAGRGVAEGVLLDCKLTGGYPDAQIYINEKEGYALYQIGGLKTYERERRYNVTEDGKSAKDAPAEKRETALTNEGLDISYTVDNRFILANDQFSSFIYIKESGEFAHAWTTMMFIGESVLPFGNHHSGHCSSNPFNQPK